MAGNDPNAPPPPPSAPSSPPPPPAQGWQSQPQQPGGPPPAGGMAGSGMPSWTSNITASGTIAGPAGTSLADIPNRLIAIFIDGIILGIIGAVINAITTGILGDRLVIFLAEVRTPNLISTVATVALVAAISAGYFIYMWLKMNGATVGMRVLKLQVRDAAGGGMISQQQAITRWALLGLPIALTQFFYWGLIGWLVWLAVVGYYVYLLVTTAQSPTRQGFHDQYVKTVVAKVA